MKFLLTILSFFLLLVTANAQQNETLLTCLGKEEWKYHQSQMSGPYYNLNQSLLNHLSSIQDVTLKIDIFKYVCEEKSSSPSLRLLSAILSQGTKIFNLQSRAGETQSFSEMRHSSIKALEAEAPHLFFSFLAQLQTLVPYPHCFKTKMPELDALMTNFLYLEEDVDVSILLKDKEKISRIFNRLESFSEIKKECAKIQEELDSKKNFNTRS